MAAISPETGGLLWKLQLPAPEGEVAMAVATPVMVGRRLVVAYHTISAADSERPDVGHHRKRQRVAVVDLDTRALDPAFPIVELAAQVEGHDGTPVDFLPSHALARSQLVHLPSPDGRGAGLVYVTFGNARDLQPWHGWLFELDLGRWEQGGAAEAVSGVFLTTPENDCGPQNSSGSRVRRCGGGLWSPTGPLVVPHDGGSAVIVASGNGRLDLGRRAYANSLLRLTPGLAFEPGCDVQACTPFDPDAPDATCMASCSNLFIPRLMPGQPALSPESGVCEDLGMYACWQALDYIGGSSPSRVVLPDGRAVLVYPAKDGQAYLVDAEHLGTLHDREELVKVCGTATDGCTMDWAGMAVAQPAVTSVGGQPVVLIPTFMPDRTHPAGLVGLTVTTREGTPSLEPRWTFPDFTTPEAVERFRRHPSQATIGTLSGGGEVAWVVEVARAGSRGTLWGVRPSDGAPLARAELTGPGFRFARPLWHDDTLYAVSCESDRGPGHLEAWRVTDVRR